MGQAFSLQTRLSGLRPSYPSCPRFDADGAERLTPVHPCSRTCCCQAPTLRSFCAYIMSSCSSNRVASSSSPRVRASDCAFDKLVISSRFATTAFKSSRLVLHTLRFSQLAAANESGGEIRLCRLMPAYGWRRKKSRMSGSERTEPHILCPPRTCLDSDSASAASIMGMAGDRTTRPDANAGTGRALVATS